MSFNEVHFYLIDIPELLYENGNDSDSDEEKWEEINNDEDENEVTDCLFCSSQFKSIEVAIQHLKSAHQFDLASQKQKFQMDFYGFIQVRNRRKFCLNSPNRF